MRKRQLKTFLLQLLCVSVLTFTVFPCNCLAQESHADAEQAPAVHDCCDEDASPEPNHDNGCDDCADCISGASCSVDYVTESVQKNSVELPDVPNYFFSQSAFVLILNPMREANLGSTGPPGVEVTSSSTLPVFYQRWLI